MLVNLLQTFDDMGRRWHAGENVDVDTQVARRWIDDGRAASDSDGKLNVPLAGNEAQAVRKQLTSGGLYLGAVGKRNRRGTYGRRVASWTALQNQAGTVAIGTPASFGIPTPPWPVTATNVLKVTQNAVASFGQQSPPDGSQAYFPKYIGNAFSAGVWVYNPQARTLNFSLTFFNVAANRNCSWNAAAEPNTWTFITLAASQQITGLLNTDAINFIRPSQKDDGPEGAWLPNEALYFCEVTADVAARPKFMICFDDGLKSQRYSQVTFKVSGAASVSSTLTNTLTTAAAHALQIGEPIVFTETAPTSLTVGTTYWVQTVPSGTTFTLATDATLASTATTTGFAGTAKYQTVIGGRSGQEIAEFYGLRGTLFIVGSWIGTSGKFGYVTVGGQFLSQDDILAMWRDGWSVGSHSNTHPSNNESAGLRLLGPYGYFLSNTFDNLPAQYLSTWSINAGNGRRRVTAGTQASPSVFTTENAHQFLPNQPIVFTDVAPTGCTLGVTYYVATVPNGTTFTLATDQGTLASKVNNTTAPFAGTCNYRWPGSSNDDTAIYADVMAGVQAVASIGIPTGGTFFALPQGSADSYVRSALIRTGIKWVRGINTLGNSIPIGSPSGGGQNLPFPAGGWLAQQDAVQTDGSLTIPQIQTYIDGVVTAGACGCNYHHEVGVTNMVALDQMCRYLRVKVDAGLMDVLTCDELGKEQGWL